LITRILKTYPAPREAFRAEMAREPGEERLLAFAMLAALVTFLGNLPNLLTMPTDAPRNALIGASLVMTLILGPIMLYCVAGLSHFVAGFFRGKGSYRSARHALFWAVIVAAPILLGYALIRIILDPLPAGSWAILPAIQLFTLWLWASFLAEVEAFSTLSVMLVFVAIAVFFAITLFMFGG
jgi:uncharacterized membrane protein